MKQIFWRLFRFCVLGGIILNMVACNGSDSTTAKTTTDSVSSPKDSVKVVKKKGKTSVTYTTATNVKIVKDAHGIYNQAEVSPEFPGGQDGLSDYINKNLAYPQTAIDNGITGTIHISFVVDEHGKVLNPQVTDSKNISNDLNAETLKMFNNMPLWKPGSIKGKNVKTRLELPVSFQLEDA
ncbi:MAG TPA: energy transducer TonB [Puia sp.]|jgi:protein TonB|nr:energy transducer TonB [Puia sp.]